MGIEPFLIASTIRIVIGQRLVRRLCMNCREHFTPDDTALTHIKQSFHITNAESFKIIHDLETQALKNGIGVSSVHGTTGSDTELSTTPSTIHLLWRPHDGGCNSCNHTGYKGRIGIYEVLRSTPAIQKLIVSNDTSENMQLTAIDEGMVTMQLDGFIKALRGETTIEEILRVTSEE
jgi:type IV pilus assembly protein PilB